MTRDQFLTEWLGECWHEGADLSWGSWSVCSKCKTRYEIPSYFNDFSTWSGFGKLWEAADTADRVRLARLLEKHLSLNVAIDVYARLKGWEEEK